jgi:tetratricopeptide (TPR) repeat protein
MPDRAGILVTDSSLPPSPPRPQPAVIGRLAHFFSELRRRRVFTFTAGYVVTAWVGIEAASVIVQSFDAPLWIMQWLIIAAVALAPVAMVLAWFFDLTRKGIVRTEEIPEPAAAAADVETPAPPELPAAAPPVESAERRLVTVLQCAVAPPGAGEDERIAERFRAEIPAIAQRFEEIVDSVEGYLLPTEGELFTAYFGVRAAHEDDALRAAVAAQGMLRHIEGLNARPEASPLRLGASAGLHCGFAIVEERRDRPVEQWISNVGQTQNGAAALQLAAADGEIRLSRDVHSLLLGRIPCDPAGEQALPGTAGLAAVYRISSLAPLEPQATVRGEMIGRDRELALLEERWEAAVEGHGSVVLVRSEPGMGKTRLVARLRERVEEAARPRLVGLQFSAYHAHSPLHPVLRQVEQAIPGLGTLQTAAEREQVLQAWLAGRGVRGAELPRILSEMLTGAVGPDATHVEPGKQKELLLGALRQILLGDAQQPVLILAEDLHWADPTSLELLALLAGEVHATRALLLMTTRPGFRAPWLEQSHVQVVSLGRLNRAQSHAIVTLIDRKGVIDDALAESIVAKADGVPLFVEELTRSVLEAAERKVLSGAKDALTIPNTLQESLAARIQHLGPAKPLLQLAATIGRESSLARLQATADVEPERVEELMQQLVDRELVGRRGLGDGTSYVFRHALIQDAAYASMLKSKREECHLRVAQAMEREQAGGGQGDEVIAHHYAEAAPTVEHQCNAIARWLAAAQSAARRSSNIEADHFLDSALRQLGRLPAGDEREVTELRLLAQRIPVLVALHGYSSPQMEQTSRRAIELCERVRDFELRYLALFSVCIFDMVGGRHHDSHATARRLATLDAENGGTLLVETEMLLGLTLFFLGRFVEAEPHLLACIDAYDRAQHGAHAYRYGQDPQVVALCYLTWLLFCRGDEARRVEAERRAVEQARSLGHPNTLGFALAWAGWSRIFTGEHAGLAEIAAELGQLGAQYGLSSFAVQGLLLESLREVRAGKPEARAAVEQGIAAWRGIGSRCFQPCWDTQLARACLDAGDTARAAEALARAAADTESTGERWSEADLHRALARLALARGDEALAEQEIERAKAVASAQQAWGWYGAAERDAAGIATPR